MRLLNRGRVRFPWLNGGRWSRVPELTLGELLDVQTRDLARLRSLDITESTPADARERALELADLALTADALFTRLCKADSTLTEERLGEILNTRPVVLAVAELVAAADADVRPRWLPADRAPPGAQHRLEDSTGKPTKTSWIRNAATWLPARSRSRSHS